MRKGDKSVKVQLLRWWVKDRELTPIERNSSKIGYMGAGFLMARIKVSYRGWSHVSWLSRNSSDSKHGH